MPVAEQVQPAQRAPVRQPQTIAWLYLLGAFAIFCALVAAGGLAGWRYYRAAMSPREGQVEINAPTGVGYRPKGSDKSYTPDSTRPDCQKPCFALREGDSVTAAREAGYGPVASIVLPDDQTQIDLFAHPNGADLTLDRYRVSRWTHQRQEVAFRQNAGYARYDVRAGQRYDEVRYSVDLGNGVAVDLAPGGSYGINVPRDAQGRPRPRLADMAPELAEVSVRDGSATVRSGGQALTLRPGEKVAVDPRGVLGRPAEAAWELIADGDFARHTSDEYNARDGTDTWSVYSGPLQAMPPSELIGYVFIQKECPPYTGDICADSERQPVVQFFRQGNQTRSFATGISQTLDVDVSEYTQSLRLTGWVRVLNQSIEGAGVNGSECPVMITLTYKDTSPTDRQKRYTRCIYIGDEDTPRDPNIRYDRVAPGTWRRIDIELRAREALGSVRYLQDIFIEARGHDYTSEVTALSLVGK
jgi:hypothetical protein